VVSNKRPFVRRGFAQSRRLPFLAKDQLNSSTDRRAFRYNPTAPASAGHAPADQITSEGRLNGLKLIVAAAAICLYLGFGIKSSVEMPGYAVVLVDDEAKTYIAQSCLDEWQHRPSETTTILRRTTAGEAYHAKYKPDAICKETGAFYEDDRSLSGQLLMKLGVLGPVQHWWDMPYRTEEGIVYPKGVGSSG
jgi:hypothetical protein